MFTQQDLDLLLEKHPKLNDFGWGNYSDPRPLTEEEIEAKFEANRVQLKASLGRVNAAATWIMERRAVLAGGKECIDRWSPCFGSYGLKHTFERDKASGGHYVTNGVFIAASLLCELPYYIDGPNCCYDVDIPDPEPPVEVESGVKLPFGAWLLQQEDRTDRDDGCYILDLAWDIARAPCGRVSDTQEKIDAALLEPDPWNHAKRSWTVADVRNFQRERGWLEPSEEAIQQAEEAYAEYLADATVSAHSVRHKGAKAVVA